MFGFRLSVKCVSVVLLAAAVASGASAEAQSTRRTRRESNANRKARIARTIEATYSHRFEVAGGGGYLRFRSGEYLQKNDEVTFFMSGTYFLNQKLGIIGEVRGLYGNAKIGNTGSNTSTPANFLPFNPQISEYPFMGGVAYRLYAKEKIALSVTGEGGAAIGKFDGDTKGVPGPDLGFWPSTNARPAFSVGLNLDLNLYPNFAFRIAPSYLGTTYGETIENNAGFEMGLVYRFGRQKK